MQGRRDNRGKGTEETTAWFVGIDVWGQGVVGAED